MILIRNIKLFPFEGYTLTTLITKYQQIIRLLLYIVVIIQPNIAFAISRLARFNINPRLEYYQEAKRVLQYLLVTQNLALQYSSKDDFNITSNTSFTNNTLDQKSS